jgi:peptide-methionine (S)-S-oxide reductase
MSGLTHAVNARPLDGSYPDGSAELVVGMGCFWGAEKCFWSLSGVYVTSVGYAAGHTANPSYQDVCSGRTGHNEVVRVIYDPTLVSLDELLRVFWQGHNPTQGMRQGNDRGTQYRSGIYLWSDQERGVAERSLQAYQTQLSANGFDPITTEILAMPDYYLAEDYHQQYLHKNPSGYCGLGGTGIRCSSGLKP